MNHYRLDIWDEAEDELLDAKEWYNLERPGLGDQLLLEVDRTLGDVQRAPLRYPRVQGDIRRAIVARFPYSVLFRIRDGEMIEVLSIPHQARDPDRWRRRGR